MTQGAIGFMRISPELYEEMLNRNISVVCRDQFQTTNHIGICYKIKKVHAVKLEK